MPAPLECKAAHLVHQWKHTAPLITCRFAPDGKSVFSASEDRTLQRWEIPSGKKTVFEGHESWPKDLAFLNNGATLVSVGCDDTMIFWEAQAEKPQPVKTIQAHKGWIRTVSVNAEESLIATAGNDKIVKLWDAEGKLVRELAGHEGDIYSSLFHPGRKWLLTGDLMGKIHQWEIATGKLLRTFDAKDLHSYNGGQQVHYGGVRSLAVTADKKRLLCCGLHKATNPLGAVNEPLVLQFEWESQKKLRSQVSSPVKGIGWRVMQLDDGTEVCASGGSGGGYLLFWKPEEDKTFHQFKLPNTAREMDLHPDGRQIATAHHDRQLRISSLTKKVEAPKKS